MDKRQGWLKCLSRQWILEIRNLKNEKNGNCEKIRSFRKSWEISKNMKTNENEKKMKTKLLKFKNGIEEKVWKWEKIKNNEQVLMNAETKKFIIEHFERFFIV